MKKIMSIAFLLGVCFLSNAQANKNDVKTFLELNGNFDGYKELIEQFSDQLSDSKRESFKKDTKIFIEQIAKADIDRYAAVFSQDEILKLIEFYRSPLGRKLVEKNKELMRVSASEIQNNYKELQGIVMKYMM